MHMCHEGAHKHTDAAVLWGEGCYNTSPWADHVIGQQLHVFNYGT